MQGLLYLSLAMRVDWDVIVNSECTGSTLHLAKKAKKEFWILEQGGISRLRTLVTVSNVLMVGGLSQKTMAPSW